MCFDSLTIPSLVQTVHHPRDRITQRFLEHRSAGLANGLEAFECPITHTTLPQLSHQHAVRQEDQIHMAGLAKAIPELTIAHAQMLLAVSMKALCPTPATPINSQDTCHVPHRSITDEHLPSFLLFFPAPQNHDPHRMSHLRNFDALREIPLSILADRYELAIFRTDEACQFRRLHQPALKNNLAVEFRIADIRSAGSMYVIEVGGVGEIAVEGEIAGNVVCDGPVDQFAKQNIVIAEFLLQLNAGFLLDESAELQRIMFAVGTDVMGDQIIVSDFIPLLGMIPEPADVVDELAVMIDQRVVDGDDALYTVRSGRIFLQPGEAGVIELFDIPEAVAGDPSVETGLIGRESEEAIDVGDIFPVRNEQPGKIFSEMLPFRLVFEERAELNESFFDDARKIDDSRHRWILHQIFRHPVSNIYRQKDHFSLNISILQKVSFNF